MVQLATRTVHGTLASDMPHGLTTTAAKSVVARPGTDLRRVAEHLEGIGIALQHELTQALPAATGHVERLLHLQQVDGVAVEMTDAMLGQNRQLLFFQPFARKQQAVAVRQKLLAAMHQGPATGLLAVE
ncbi:hypothetical protein D3C86_1292040 [compost metagenome]